MSDEFSFRAQILDSERSTAISLAVGAAKWLETSYKRLESDQSYTDAQYATDVARHAADLRAQLMHVEGLNIGMKALAGAMRSMGFQLPPGVQEECLVPSRKNPEGV